MILNKIYLSTYIENIYNITTFISKVNHLFIMYIFNLDIFCGYKVAWYILCNISHFQYKKGKNNMKYKSETLVKVSTIVYTVHCTLDMVEFCHF